MPDGDHIKVVFGAEIEDNHQERARPPRSAGAKAATPIGANVRHRRRFETVDLATPSG
jgi:hypothetical protein